MTPGAIEKRLHHPEIVYFFAFPNFENAADLDRLQQGYRIESIRRFRHQGYEIPVRLRRKESGSFDPTPAVARPRPRRSALGSSRGIPGAHSSAARRRCHWDSRNYPTGASGSLMTTRLLDLNCFNTLRCFYGSLRARSALELRELGPPNLTNGPQ